MSTIGRTVTPGASIGQTKYEMPECLATLGIGACEKDPESRHVRVGGPHLLAGDDPPVAVLGRPGPEPGQVGARCRLAEELAPDLLARQKRRKVAVLLLSSSGMHEGRACPADPDRIEGPSDPRGPQLLVDDELVDRARGEAPGPRPVRCDVARLAPAPAAAGPGGRASHARTATRAGWSSPGRARSTGPKRRLPAVTDWNYADVWETVADQIPEATALVHGNEARHLGRDGQAR